MLSDQWSWDTTPVANLIELCRILKLFSEKINNRRTETRVRCD